MYFLVNTSPLKLLDVELQTLQMHRSYNVKVSGQHFKVTLARSKVK